MDAESRPGYTRQMDVRVPSGQLSCLGASRGGPRLPLCHSRALSRGCLPTDSGQRPTTACGSQRTCTLCMADYGGILQDSAEQACSRERGRARRRSCCGLLVPAWPACLPPCCVRGAPGLGQRGCSPAMWEPHRVMLMRLPLAGEAVPLQRMDGGATSCVPSTNPSGGLCAGGTVAAMQAGGCY
jgi:hypothetical protein